VHHGLGNRNGEANVLANLGEVQQLTGDYESAVANLTSALDLYRSLGNRIGEGNALHQLGTVRLLTGNFPAAAASLGDALKLHQRLGNKLGEANAIRAQAALQHLTGNRQAAADGLARALEMQRALGNRTGEAEVLNDMGEFIWDTVTPAQSLEYHEKALLIATEIGSQFEKARAIEGIGLCLLKAGQAGKGAARLCEALVIYREMGVPQARRAAETLCRYRP